MRIVRIALQLAVLALGLLNVLLVYITLALGHLDSGFYGTHMPFTPTLVGLIAINLAAGFMVFVNRISAAVLMIASAIAWVLLANLSIGRNNIIMIAANVVGAALAVMASRIRTARAPSS